MSVLTAAELTQLGALARKLGLQGGRKKVGVYPANCYR